MPIRHYVCFPSADPKRGLKCALEWMAQGYKPLVMLDQGKSIGRDGLHIIECRNEEFPGYYRVINEIVSVAFKNGADLVTCIGDDMEPPIQGAQWVSDAYLSRFHDGYGMMQGIGDTQGDTMTVPGYEHLGPLHNAGRICGSPTFGRGWFERGYNGFGPFNAGYKSYYGDEDLWHVAMRTSVLWLNPEITILHNHWAFGRMTRQPYHERAERNWRDDQKLFFLRRASGFPDMATAPVKKETP